MACRRRAMTLIELTIVILILGITAAIAAPRFSDAIRMTQLRTAANTLAAHIDYVRAVAVNESRTTTLVFDNTFHTYSCGEVDLPEQPGVRMRVSIPRSYDTNFEIDAKFNSGTTLSFDFQGSPKVGSTDMASGRVAVRLGKEAYLVTVDPGTGRTTVTRSTAADIVAADLVADTPLVLGPN